MMFGWVFIILDDVGWCLLLNRLFLDMEQQLYLQEYIGLWVTVKPREAPTSAAAHGSASEVPRDGKSSNGENIIGEHPGLFNGKTYVCTWENPIFQREKIQFFVNYQHLKMFFLRWKSRSMAGFPINEMTMYHDSIDISWYTLSPKNFIKLASEAIVGSHPQNCNFYGLYKPSKNGWSMIALLILNDIYIIYIYISGPGVWTLSTMNSATGLPEGHDGGTGWCGWVP